MFQAFGIISVGDAISFFLHSVVKADASFDGFSYMEVLVSTKKTLRNLNIKNFNLIVN